MGTRNVLVFAGHFAEFAMWCRSCGFVACSEGFRDGATMYRYVHDAHALRGLGIDWERDVRILPGFYYRSALPIIVSATQEFQVFLRRSGRTVEGPVIVIEGPDGSGKTTTAHAVQKRMGEYGWTSVYSRMPGGTRIGELLRGPLKDASFEMSPLVKTLLFAAVDQASNELAEAQARQGAAVILDRSALSNLAYRVAQGEEAQAELLRVLFDLEREDEDGCAMRGGGGVPSWKLDFVPDVAGAMLYLLDAPDEVLRKRVEEGRGQVAVAKDRFDGIWKKAAEVYRAFAHCPGLGARSVDSSRPLEVVVDEICEHALKTWFLAHVAPEARV